MPRRRRLTKSAVLAAEREVSIDHGPRGVSAVYNQTISKLQEWGYGFHYSTFVDLWAKSHVENAEQSPEHSSGAPEQPNGPDTHEAPSGPIVGGTVKSPAAARVRTSARTLVFTCAQNNTYLHENFWASLQHFCEERGAELHVSRLTYNKASISAGKAKPGTEKVTDNDDVWYDPRITPYISDSAIQITDDLVWCGELNILPTRVNPLSTFKTYTRRASGIIPHVKMAMESQPVMRGEHPRILYTTGTVTLRNYIQKAAGQVAEFHHVFGALVVEIDEDNNWWCRQLNANSEGVFYDLVTKYGPYGAEPATVPAIVHGDIHIGKKDIGILDTVFGAGGVVDQLLPSHQFFHDIVDFTPRNHHNIKDPHFSWTDAAKLPVEDEFKEAANLLYAAHRGWSTLHVVVSNHDQAILQWLKNTDGFKDQINYKFWLEMNHIIAKQTGEVIRPHPFAYALRNHSVVDYHIIKEDDSYRLFDIEFGLHGHLGPNGARGSPRNLKAIGKANTAHTHSAGIVEGVYTAGVYGKMDMGYNKGPSSWSQSFVLTYHNGKRAICTFRAGKPWRGFEYV